MSFQEFRPSRFQILPPVVKNLLIINGIMFLATVVLEDKLGIQLARILGLHYFESEYFRPYQFITHLFMHGSFIHILSNMFALWMFGNVLENVWGPKRFLTYYFVTGLGAALIHTGFTWYELNKMAETMQQFYADVNPESFKGLINRYQGYILPDQYEQLNRFYNLWQVAPADATLKDEAIEFSRILVKNKTDIPTVGASGAVFGVLLAFGMLFPNVMLYLYFAIPIKAKYFVILYGLFELYSGLQNNPADNVAHFAHLGGMLFGYLMIRTWNKQRFRNY